MYEFTPKKTFIMRTADAIAGHCSAVRETHEGLALFQDALRKKMHGVQFADGKAASGTTCWVYYPHETFCRGRLHYKEGFRRFNTYAVLSRTIENMRHPSSTTDDHFTHQSKNLNTAVKKAAAALTPWSVGEIASVHSKVYEGARSDLVDAIKAKIKVSFRELGIATEPVDREGRDPTFDKTIAWQTLRDTQDLIPDLEARAKVIEQTRQLQELGEVASVGAEPTFVHICKTRQGEQQLAVQKKCYVRWGAVESEERSEFFNERTEGYSDLVGKISVLNMMQVGEYVTGVGLKADEDMFYVC